MAAVPAFNPAGHPQGTTQLYFVYDDRCMHALVAKQASSGVLLCVPMRGLPDGVLEEAEEAGFADLIGPYTATSVAASLGGSRPSKRMLEIVLFDLDSSGLAHLHVELPSGFDAAEVIEFGNYRGSSDWPHVPALLTLAEDFVQCGGARLDSYYSAVEEGEQAVPSEGMTPPHTGGAASTEAMLARLLAQSESTQQAVAGMQGHISQLQTIKQRLDLLEQRQQPSSSQTVKAAPAPQLFQNGSATLDAGQRARLQQLAGRGPPNLGDLGGTAALHRGGPDRKSVV